MKERYLTPIELYMRNAFRLIVLLTPIAAICASGTFTLIKLLGMYESVPWTGLLLFDVTDV